MSLLLSSDVKDLQFMEAVANTLKEGIASVCNICKSLLDAHVDPNTDKCSNYIQIRQQIELAEHCLKKSETMTKKKLRNLDEHMEQLIQKKEHDEQMQRDKSLEIDKFHKEKTSSEQLLNISKAALEQAKKNLASEEEAVKKEREREESLRGLTTAGAVMFVIPVFGWIAGAVMVGVGESERSKALDSIKAAEEERERCDSQVQECIKKVSDYQNKIFEKQTEIKETNKALNKIREEIKELKHHLVVIAEIQQNVRKVVKNLSVFTGRVTVLERQTQRFILYEPVIKVMENVLEAAVNIARNQILYSQGEPCLINNLMENKRVLLALCNSPNTSEDDSYY
ncbi:uncharacterized protein si:dkey-85k15.4 [Xyrauchen texanus]|uniref:uncharacterized protein si:dkey-85k15.4 n=1 Tax=Xyrauchen texanus TaxID=154827 RepID=UPI00224209B9|nr:uncharacterized protein si:dkey-85k15.4 [Xyrauchen texanus]